ncbi:MAG: hypothetical protein WBC21_04535 [Minisyncoccales bacterium]
MFVCLKCLNVKMNKAMTLIEVVVVVVIMFMLFAVVFINPRPSADLDRAARQLASDLRRVQNMAMAAETQIDGWGDEIVPCGYGIYTPNTQKYVIFYNETACSNLQHYAGSIDPEEILLQEEYNITITQGLSIYFTPPSGTTYMQGDYPAADHTFTLTASDGSTRTVTVTSAGKIEIQ